MKIRNLLILGLVLLGFTYCSSDEVLDGPTTGNETAENLKMEIVVQMPTAATTRTSTDGDLGSQAGEDYEGKPNSVVIAIFNKSGEQKGYHKSGSDDDAVAGDKFITTAEFKIPSLEVGTQYYVYAFVNPHAGILEALELNAEYDKEGTKKANLEAVLAEVANTTGEGSFFMSNAEKVLSPKVEQSHIKGAPLKVGINVQRAVARMDFTGTTTSFDLDGAKVVLTHFKPMNASKSFYNLKHVVAATNALAAPEAAALTAAIGVAEDNTNYVVDTDWATKISGATADDWKGNFHSYMGSTTTTKDNYTTFQDKYTELTAKSSFYTTENTLPADPTNKVNNNTKGIATAVVFKGYLDFTDHTTETQPVYVWNNKFYGTFDKLPAGIQAIGETNTANLASAGVTGYSKVDGKYPIYYVYYNVHNQLDPADSANVGPMEFGVVRNNIYQLSIKSLSKFGHPNDPELNPDTPSVDADGISIVKNPDPSPEDPTHPIKSSELYMQVTATVLNWTVRTNEIEF